MAKLIKHVAVHATVHAKTFIIMFSEPQIYIPKRLSKSGNKVPDISKPWHVYYYYRHPITKKMVKFIYKNGVNRYKTVTLRRAFANQLRKDLHELLIDGLSPYSPYLPEIEIPIGEHTILTAFEEAYKNKVNEWKENTAGVMKAHFSIFKEWLDSKGISNLPINQFKRRETILFLNYLKEQRKVSNTTRNNYKRTLSTLLTKMVMLEIIEYNPAEKIALLKQAPSKNKAYSESQLKDITNWLKKNDPYLHRFLKFVTYGFMRPVEVTRIKIKNIDLERRIISVDTKTNANKITIIDTLAAELRKMQVENYKPEDFLFTKKFKSGTWDTDKEKSKVAFFIKRFRKVKKEFNLGNEFGMYSFRHNASLNLYHSFIASGLDENTAINKLQKIMRHTDSKTTRVYLRNIGALKVADYSADFTFDF